MQLNYHVNLNVGEDLRIDKSVVDALEKQHLLLKGQISNALSQILEETVQDFII